MNSLSNQFIVKRIVVGQIFGWAMAGFVLSFSLFPAMASGQDDPQVAATNWRVERDALDREYADRLQEIAAWCRENDIEQQVAETFKLYVPRDLGRQYIFLPSELAMPTPPEGILGQWITRISEVRVWQAERIFELAKKAAAAGAGTAAFQLINEVIFFDRDHAAVRDLLGHRKTEDGWRVASDRIQVRPSSKPNDLLKWPAKSYLLVLTPNFEIESNASEERTRYLAEQLERWHGVWRQVFFEYWSSSDALQRWIDGKSSYRHSRKRFRVIFFKDRSDYVSNLAQMIRGIEASTGYYSADERVSFFYDSQDPSVEETWRHELTHQLFRESIKTNKSPFDEQFIWLDEGISTYFESLTDFDNYVTLGGFEARRMQYARVRLLLEGFYIPLAELSQIGREQLQQRKDIARLYSQAAGLTDMLMNDQSGNLEPKLAEFLKLLYTGPSRRMKDDTFEQVIGYSYDELDARYKDYLTVNPNAVVKHLTLPLTRTEMSLSGTDLQEAGFDALGQCYNLGWVDLSGNAITADRLLRLVGCRRLSQLFLTECRLAPGCLKALTQFENLEELDLSGSTIVDQQLAELAGNETLKSLRLAATRITDKGLVSLERLPNLRSLDVSRSLVTEQGIARLQAKLPALEITK